MSKAKDALEGQPVRLGRYIPDRNRGRRGVLLILFRTAERQEAKVVKKSKEEEKTTCQHRL